MMATFGPLVPSAGVNKRPFTNGVPTVSKNSGVISSLRNRTRSGSARSLPSTVIGRSGFPPMKNSLAMAARSTPATALACARARSK